MHSRTATRALLLLLLSSRARAAATTAAPRLSALRAALVACAFAALAAAAAAVDNTTAAASAPDPATAAAAAAAHGAHAQPQRMAHGLHALRSARTGQAYLLSVPPNCSTAAPAPLVLFLHGAGESGAGDAWGLLPGYDAAARAWLPGVAAPVRVTPPGLAADASPLAHGFFVLAPRTRRGWGAATHADTLALLDEVLAAHPCADGARVLLTGISMGGAGAFLLGSAAASRFAGVAPICGYGADDARALAAGLARTPMRVVHGTNDEVVPEAESAALVEALRAAGNERVQYERTTGVAPAGYPSMAGHDSWSEAYGGEEWWRWARALQPVAAVAKP
jgi:predicted peptidase